MNNNNSFKKPGALIFFLSMALILDQIACRSTVNTNQLSTTEEPIVTETLTGQASTQEYENSYPTAIPTLNLTPDLEQLRSDLLGAPCITPCWIGIDPGVTVANEVPNILSRLKEEGLVVDFNLVHHPINISYNVLFAPGFSGSISINEELNIVTDTGIGSSSVKFITLGDVINAYGTPTLVADGAGDSFNGVYGAYPEQEIFFWARTDSFHDEMVTSEMTVTNLRYLSFFTSNNPLKSPEITWVNWEGYQTFSYYYQRIHDEENKQ